MLIRNARWLDNNGNVRSGSIRIEGQAVHSLGVETPDDDAGSEIFDAAGLLALPGLIDAHTHFREPGGCPKEGIANGSRAALAGGVTTVLDMPNNRPTCSTPARLEAKKSLFRRKCRTNWGLHILASTTAPVPEAIASAKVFMSPSGQARAVVSVDELATIFVRYPRVTIHAEDASEFPQGTNLRHHLARPRSAIVNALRKIETAYEKLDARQRPRLALCHISTREEVEWLRTVKRRGWDVWGETCPHYLFFTQTDQQRAGPVLQANPPLRGTEDRAALLEALADGTIDYISTDHAPHLPGEKASVRPPSGIASIEWFLPLLASLADRGSISWKRLLQIACENPTRCFDIPLRNGIKPGNIADIVFISPAGAYLPDRKIVTRAQVNPYAGFTFTRRVEAVLVNGAWAYSRRIYINNSSISREAYEQFQTGHR
ncbi:MAG TPA: dihydroorotase family protein [Candidatus Ozemobacteraceae bacterium]|nr:dihydroorotase family protein [Candidatus Ozemobacteraceae bacterium]